AQRAASTASTRSIGGAPGCTSTSSTEIGADDDIAIPLSSDSNDNGSGSDTLLGARVDQGCQIRKRGVTGDVLERHGPIQRDCELQRRQRRPAEIEEVIAPANLVFSNAEHVRPCLGQPV